MRQSEADGSVCGPFITLCLISEHSHMCHAGRMDHRQGGLARDFVGDYIKRHPNCTNESVVQVWDSSVRGAGLSLQMYYNTSQGHNPYGVGIFLERQYVANVRRSFFGSDKGKGTPSMTGVPRVQNLSLHHQNQVTSLSGIDEKTRRPKELQPFILCLYTPAQQSLAVSLEVVRVVVAIWPPPPFLYEFYFRYK